MRSTIGGMKSKHPNEHPVEPFHHTIALRVIGCSVTCTTCEFPARYTHPSSVGTTHPYQTVRLLGHQTWRQVPLPADGDPQTSEGTSGPSRTAAICTSASMIPCSGASRYGWHDKTSTFVFSLPGQYLISTFLILLPNTLLNQRACLPLGCGVSRTAFTAVWSMKILTLWPYK